MSSTPLPAPLVALKKHTDSPVGYVVLHAALALFALITLSLEAARIDMINQAWREAIGRWSRLRTPTIVPAPFVWVLVVAVLTCVGAALVALHAKRRGVVYGGHRYWSSLLLCLAMLLLHTVSVTMAFASTGPGLDLANAIASFSLFSWATLVVLLLGYLVRMKA